METAQRLREPDEFDTHLVCAKCGQRGTAVWARNTSVPGRRVTATSPVATSDNFYLRVVALPSANPHIVCAACGTVHRDTVA